MPNGRNGVWQEPELGHPLTGSIEFVKGCRELAAENHSLLSHYDLLNDPYSVEIWLLDEEFNCSSPFVKCPKNIDILIRRATIGGTVIGRETPKSIKSKLSVTI